MLAGHSLEALDERRIRDYVATGRQKHPASGDQKRRAPWSRPCISASSAAVRKAATGGESRSSSRLSNRTMSTFADPQMHIDRSLHKTTYF